MTIRFDDLLPEESDTVQTAIKRLPPKEAYDRIFRIRRAFQVRDWDHREHTYDFIHSLTHPTTVLYLPYPPPSRWANQARRGKFNLSSFSPRISRSANPGVRICNPPYNIPQAGTTASCKLFEMKKTIKKSKTQLKNSYWRIRVISFFWITRTSNISAPSSARSRRKRRSARSSTCLLSRNKWWILLSIWFDLVWFESVLFVDSKILCRDAFLYLILREERGERV